MGAQALSLMTVLVLVGPLASGPPDKKPPARQFPVVVAGAVKAGEVRQGEPIPITVTVHHGLKGPIHFRGYGVKPTAWNAETVSVRLVDIHREGTAGGLFLRAPAVTVPREVAGFSAVAIAPGASLTIETDARKWEIRGGWVPGRYRVTVRVDGLQVDAYTTASVLSEPFTFVIP